MVVPEGVMADLKKRAKAKRRGGIFLRGETYWLRKTIGKQCYQVNLHVQKGRRDDAVEVAALVLKEIALGLHGGGVAPDLATLIDLWCHLHRKQERHTAAARWAEQALGTMTKLPLPSITTERLEEWLAAYLEDHAPATCNLVLRYLKVWLRWAVERKTPGLPGMPCKITMQRVEKRARPVVKISGQDDFLRGVDCVKTWVRTSQLAELQVRAAVRLMLGCGLREAEALGARWEWIDAGQGEYQVGKAKGMRPRTLGVPAWVMPWILALPRTVSGLVFPAPDGGQHPAGWLRKALARGARAAGVVGTLGNHRLRASFATRHAAAGTSLDAIQGMMGHTDISTTRGYIEDDLGRQKQAQDKLAGMMAKGG